MTRAWTQAQLSAIRSRGKNLLVSAGAGSGKTAVMIERIVSLLREGAQLERMLVCTFTRTAALDMKRKLADALSDDPALHKQLHALQRAEISTLHAWCAHVLKAWFFEDGADPEFTVLEEGEERVLKAEAAEEAIAACKESGDTAFAGLYAVFLRDHSHEKLTKALLNVYDYARAQPDPQEWLRRTAAHTDGEYRAVLYEEVRCKEQKLRQKIEALLPGFAESGYAPDHAALCELLSCMEREVAYTAPTVPLRKNAANKDVYDTLKEWHDAFAAVKKEYGDLIAERAEIQAMPSHEESLPYCAALASLACKLDEVYAQKKRARGKADYSDLEHRTLAVLRRRGEEIARQYDYVFVDEYQDISPLQEEILSAFSCRMFFVGDVKQSIYGFRMCRPDFFLRKRALYAAGAGEVIDLNANFRSGGEILDAVNDVFSSVMTEDFGGADYASAQLTAGKRLSASVRAVRVPAAQPQPLAPALYSVQSDAGERADTADACEADAVMTEILDMLQKPIATDDGERPTEYGDIAVLVRSRGAFVEQLEKKLRAASIPVCVAVSDTDACEFPSVSALISMLRVLNNARDEVQLAAVLLYPAFGGCTPEDLATLKLCGGTLYDGVFGAWQGKTERETRVRETATRWASELSDLRALAAELSVAELAGEITARYKCFHHALNLGGEREAAALDMYLEHLAAQDEHSALREYLAYIDACGTPRLKVQDGGNAVRILSVHASKGLEFPCVLLPELNKQFNRSDVFGSVICDEQEGVVLRSFDFAERSVAVNPRFAVCSAKLKRALAAEELRILYVAMTRARNRLTLFYRDDEKERVRRAADANSYFDWLYDFLRRADAPPAEGDGPDAALPLSAPDARTVDALTAHFAASPPAYSAAVQAKASVSGLIRGEEEETRTPALYADDRAAKRGSAYHKFMQWVRFGETGEWERLQARFPAEAAEIDRAEIERAFAAVNAFIGARNYVREKAFVYRTDEGMLVQGVIDLLVFEPDGSAVIVDYKTGDPAHLCNQAYARQLKWYRTAVEKALGKTVTACYLFGFADGKFRSIE